MSKINTNTLTENKINSKPINSFKEKNNKKNKLFRISKDYILDVRDKTKDFFKIKKIADLTPPIDNSRKIQELKLKIDQNLYNIDYEKLAEKILGEEISE